MKGLEGSNPPFSANQSVHFAYILEKEETPREMRRSFYPQRTGESASRRIRDHQRARHFQPWGGVAPPFIVQTTEGLILQ